MNGSGVGIVLVTPEGQTLEYAMKFQFPATNNEAEYEAVIARLELCTTLEAKKVKLMTEFELVIKQINGEYETRDPAMVEYLSKVKSIVSNVQGFEAIQLPRSEN